MDEAGGGFVKVSVAVTRPPAIRFQDGRNHDGVLVFVEEGFVIVPVSVLLRRFPRTELVAYNVQSD
jgi:hypothetical protein